MMNTNQYINPNGVNGSTPAQADAPSPGSGVVQSQATQGRHQTTGTSSRRRFSRNDNKTILRCYYASSPERWGYRQRMLRIWGETGSFTMSEQRMADQVRVIRKNGWFTTEELEEIKNTVASEKMGNSIQNTEQDEQAPSINDIQEPSPDVLQHENRNQSPVAENCNDPMGESMLSEEKQLLIRTILEKRAQIDGNRPQLRSVRNVNVKKLKQELNKINSVLEYVPVNSVTELNDTLYASAALVTEQVGGTSTRGKNEEPPWRVRLSKRVKGYQQELSRLDEAKQRDHGDQFRKKLERKHDVKRKGYQLVIEELKQRLVATASKIKRYDDRQKQYRQNRLFDNNQKQFYQEIQKKTTTTSVMPDAEETKNFWKEIWGHASEHNRNASWLERVEESLSRPEKQQEMKITEEKLRETLMKLPNWKAPGPDGVQGFWIKNFTSLHRLLARYLNDCLEKGDTPKWMTTGRTVLIQKDPDKGVSPGNFRPITCLPLLWKVLTSMISDNIYRHLEDNNLIGEEQKGCRRGYKGAKDHLMLDKAILRHCKRRRTNLAMGWIDYQKAYDLVPHSWILETMRMVGVSKNIICMLKSSMTRWNTCLEAGGQQLASVDIKRGIFQGDSLSPLLFIIGLIPLSVILRDAKQGYSLRKTSSDKINHLMYMDDLKLYGKSKDELESLVHTVRIFTNDIQMRFGIEKCATLLMKRGRKISGEGIELPDGQVMRDLGEQGYKYLGVLEASNIKMEEMKAKTSKEYIRRVKLLLNSKLSGGKVIKGINTWAVAVLRYSAGILNWSKEEIQSLDRKTRKVMTMNRALHPRANVARLYLPRGEGGRGMKSVEDAVRMEECALSDYVQQDKGYNRFLSEFQKNTTKDQYVREAKESKQSEWQEKALHGQYVKLIETTRKEQTYKWLRNGYLKKETEGLITAAQDQALATRWRKVKIEKVEGSALCRMCNQKDETVFHILSECSKLAQSEYKKRHDKVAQIVHWNMCKTYGLPHSRRWYGHVAERVTENDRAKILWDVSVQTDHIIEARRPDIILVDKELNHTWIVDIAVPGDGRVDSKEKEKVEKYQELGREIRKLWKTSVNVIPIVVGALGAVSKLDAELVKLGIGNTMDDIQFAALLGSARIIRKVLDISG